MYVRITMADVEYIEGRIAAACRAWPQDRDAHLSALADILVHLPATGPAA